MRIKVFAVLKDYLPEEFEIDFVPNTDGVKKSIIAKNASAAAILPKCRFAVGNAFVNENHVFSENDIVAVIPPSSGG